MDTTDRSLTGLPRAFITRRLHSLFGIIPIGGFLLIHIYTNTFSLGPNGPAAYNAKIHEIQETPFLLLVELLVIFLPILFHALYGLIIIFEGRSNGLAYPHEANLRYSAQRITGVIALIYISYHVYKTRILSFVQGTPMTYDWMEELLANPATMWLYLIGTTATVFHFANGVWTFAITWGLTVTAWSQRLLLYGCMGLFAILSLVNWLIVLNFAYGKSGPAWVMLSIDWVQTYLFGNLL